MIEDFSEHIQSQIKTLPDLPGVYQYYDENELLLYVGKAKNLKKRVSSYFMKEHDSGRLRMMVKQIRDIRTVKVNSELDALLLENNLIKNLKPKYNINLRDDKTYPWIILKKERFPRLFYTRRQVRDGSDYFGPYASVKVMYTLLELIRQTYPLRTCSYDLSKENIDKGKFRACLEFHIGKCKAPCVNKQSEEEYNQNIQEIKQIIKGDCTDAQEKVLALQNDSVIIVNVHDLDSLKETNSIGILNAYKKNTATAMIDRTYFSGPESVSVTRPYYNNLVAKQLKTVTPASVSIINKTYNSVTKQLSFTVKADFIGDVKGDLRLNAYLTENNVSGPSSDVSANGYNQLNNYYNVPWSPYYQLGNYSSTYSNYVLKPYQFKHHNTLVYSFDGSFGNPGLIPTNGGTQGQSYQKTYTLTVPTPTNSANLYNSDNLYIVAFLAEYNSNQNNRNVLNVAKQKITPNSEILGLQEQQGNSFISLFPNPSNGNMYINSPKSLNTYEIKAIDIMGRCVFIETLNQVGNQAQLDLSALNNGVYFLSISSENGNFIEKVIIQKN